MSEILTKDEIALYDRQIRLWGMATQLRIKSAKLLVINLGAVGTEVVKNLVLGGVNSLEILDDSVVKEEDFSAQFFLPNDDTIVGSLKLPLAIPQIQELNSRVNLTINTNSLGSHSKDYFSQFDLVIATELSKQEIISLNHITRELGIPLYTAGVHGMFGYILTDLISHESASEKDIGNQSRVAGTKLAPRKTITKVDYNSKSGKENVVILDEFTMMQTIFESDALPKQLNRRQLKRLSAAVPLVLSLFEIPRPQNLEEDIDINLLTQEVEKTCMKLNIPRQVATKEYIQLFAKQAYTEFSPVAAILGGCLAQDVIQFLSKKESPINNCLILDGLKSEMPIFTL